MELDFRSILRRSKSINLREIENFLRYNSKIDFTNFCLVSFQRRIYSAADPLTELPIHCASESEVHTQRTCG